MASTTDMNTITFRRCGMGYQIIHKTNQRTGVNETKAYPKIYICLLTKLTGDYLSWNALKKLCIMPLGDKFQVFAR